MPTSHSLFAACPTNSRRCARNSARRPRAIVLATIEAAITVLPDPVGATIRTRRWPVAMAPLIRSITSS